MAFQFKIQLRNITDPPVWRRLLVPEQFTFLRLHSVIQTAFGWQNCHMFQFSQKGYASNSFIGIPNPEMEGTQDAQQIKLSEIFTLPKQKFIYIYDFGDDWFHQINLEKITDDKLLRATCMAGMGACPPEDCGGPYGYENLKVILNDPKDPENASMKEWLGMSKKEKWDAAFFDLEKTKAVIAKV